jgi:DNA polymerase-3 subunit delta'
MNWNMVGHEWAVSLLRQHVAQGSFRHAYLITGPRGVGRRTLALRFAQAINCPQPAAPGEPCLSCRTCQQISQMQHPDLAVIQAELIGGTLKVEQVRELQRNLALAPYAARYRIALMLRFEEAHPSAANALLKTLEEPPSQVIVLLTAISSESLLPTIVSRCETLRLRRLPLESVGQALRQGWGLSADQSRLFAHISGGRPGYALQLRGDPQLLESRQEAILEHRRLLTTTRARRFQSAEKLAKNKDQMRIELEIWLSMWRDILHCAAVSEIDLTNIDISEEIHAYAARFGLQTAHQMVMALQRTLEMLERNTNARLALEVLMLDLPCL